jgi:predicted acylesterase/phospholipase RssA
MTKKLWIILPGGGVKGVFQIGFIEGMLDKYKDEVIIDKVYGTSVGAIMAPLIAARRFDIIHEIFDSINGLTDIFESWGFLDNLIKVIPIFTKLGAYKKVKLVDKVIYKLQSALTKSDLIECYKKCNVVAWDFVNKNEVWFNGDDLEFGMKASSALTIAVPPVPYKGGSYLTDGGVTEMIPITKAIEHYQMDSLKDDITILIVDCSTRKMQKLSKVPNDPIMYILELLADAAANSSSAEFARVQESFPAASMLYVSPDNDIFNNPIDIDKKKMQQQFQNGYTKGFSFSF